MPRQDLRERLARRWFSPVQGARHADWVGVRRERRLAIDPAYRGRARLMSITTRVASFEARIERARFGRLIDDARVEAPLFVLGHYRSGTTHLHNLLARDPRLGFANYYQVSFPHGFLGSESIGSRLFGPLTMRTRPQDDVALGLGVPAEDELALCTMTFLSPHLGWHFPRAEPCARRFLTFDETPPAELDRWSDAMRCFARKLSLRQPGRTLVLKSPCHTARVAALLRVFPDARFVHIHRDPFDVFRSTRHMERRVAPFFRFQECEPDDLDRRILWRYRAMYDALERDRPRIPAGRIVDLAYDDLIERPLDSLRRIYERLSLPAFGEVRPRLLAYLERVSGYRPNRHESPDAVTRARIESEWGPMVRAYRRRSSVCASVPRSE